MDLFWSAHKVRVQFRSVDRRAGRRLFSFSVEFLLPVEVAARDFPCACALNVFAERIYLQIRFAAAPAALPSSLAIFLAAHQVQQQTHSSGRVRAFRHSISVVFLARVSGLVEFMHIEGARH